MMCKTMNKFGENKLLKNPVLNKKCMLTCKISRYSPKHSISSLKKKARKEESNTVI